MKFILFTFLLVWSKLVFSHSVGPNWQDVYVRSQNFNVSFIVNVTNNRSDVSDFFISVEDYSTKESLPFSSSDRFLKLKKDEAKRVRIFVKNDNRERLRVCVWTRNQKSLDGQQVILSAVCSGVRLHYSQ